MNNKNISNQKGVTLIELLISIVVGSIVISMLMSILMLSIKVKATFEVNNRMQEESYYIIDKIQSNLLELGPQEIEIVTVGTTTTVTISHVYDIALNEFNIIFPDYSVPDTVHQLIFDSSLNTLVYQTSAGGVLLHSSNVSILPGSSLQLTNIEPVGTCDFDPSTTGGGSEDPCSEAILKLSLLIDVDLDNGGIVDPKMFVTTIII